MCFHHRIFPESLRWLLATQQYSRSKWIIEGVAKKNNVNLEQDAEELMTGVYKNWKTNTSRSTLQKMTFFFFVLFSSTN